MKTSWAILKYWNLMKILSCIEKLREHRNCNRNLHKRINICICVIRSELVFLFLEVVLCGNYCSTEAGTNFFLLCHSGNMVGQFKKAYLKHLQAELCIKQAGFSCVLPARIINSSMVNPTLWKREWNSWICNLQQHALHRSPQY